jgi:hypothetical protein
MEMSKKRMREMLFFGLIGAWELSESSAFNDG